MCRPLTKPLAKCICSALVPAVICLLFARKVPGLSYSRNSRADTSNIASGETNHILFIHMMSFSKMATVGLYIYAFLD